jgi:hypothetical protein
MSRTLLPLAGFEVTFNGRFWVTTEDNVMNGVKGLECLLEAHIGNTYTI